MSIATAFVIIFVLFPIAALLLLFTLCLHTEYALYRAKQIGDEQLKSFFGDDDLDDEPVIKYDILDYSKTPSTGI